MRAWIASGDFPRAIFAANDPSAIGAMQAVEEAGLRVGVDVALIGAGNIHHGDMLRVPLSTISWSRAEMGQAAATILMKLIDGAVNGAKAAQRILIPPQLLIRKSCGAAQRAKVQVVA
jgi:LacI family transcriptional regulator